MTRDDDHVSQIAATVQRGSIVAAAGCGKTEQIARATGRCEGCRLILTHTHAGVDALKERLAKNGVPEEQYRIDTIAGWSFRFAAAFPATSGLILKNPSDGEWDAVYECATKLVTSRAISSVIAASYKGLFVDEYQDCTVKQHELICALAQHMPTCLFGDPLQAIFGFRGNRLVNWETDVFPVFPKIAELHTPWRWKDAGNAALGTWLERVRHRLECDEPVNLDGCPSCVQWRYLPPDEGTPTGIVQRQKVIVNACMSVEVQPGERLVVIGDSANLKSRANLAQKLARLGFENIEPISCQDLFDHASSIESLENVARMEAVLKFAEACMTGTEKSALKEAVKSHLGGGTKGAAKFGELIPLCLEITNSRSWSPVVGLLETMRLRPGTRLYRREMFFSMRAALQMMVTTQHTSLTDAVWQAQNRLRHAGRRLGKRSIGSTLLVKGLQFHHAIIIDPDRLSAKDLYVALTRPMRSLLILSRSKQIVPRRPGRTADRRFGRTD